MFHKRLIKSISGSVLAGAAMLLAANAALADGELYTLTILGNPPGADSAIGVRMNNLGHVAGWSQYFGQGEPSLKGWVWTPEDGFTVLPPPPGFFLGRSRAMDISDTGIVAGDGGFDIGLAWRYENGTYTVTGGVQGMPGAYLGGINNAGDIAGTAKDGTIATPDFAWVDFNGGELLTIPLDGGRATDVNNIGQVTGSTQGPGTPFQAFRWDQESGIQFLGSLGLAFSFANAINDSGQVVGSARSATGNTTRAWIYADELGMQELPAPFQNTSVAISHQQSGACGRLNGSVGARPHVVVDGRRQRDTPDFTVRHRRGQRQRDQRGRHQRCGSDPGPRVRQQRR